MQNRIDEAQWIIASQLAVQLINKLTIDEEKITLSFADAKTLLDPHFSEKLFRSIVWEGIKLALGEDVSLPLQISRLTSLFYAVGQIALMAEKGEAVVN